MNVKDEVEAMGPGFKRRASSMRQGFWTPKLATWSDKDGFVRGDDLQYYTWVSGVKVTGFAVNASPVICVVESEIAEQDLWIEVTGHTGQPTGSITSGGITITGFEVNHQYGIDVYRHSWCTGAAGYTGSFGIDANELPGTTILLPNKRIYSITDVNVYISGTTTIAQRATQPLTKLGFYALADNGSKLLYTFNWDKIYEDMRAMTFGRFAAPKRCPTCMGSGTVSDVECFQCDGYGYNGYNSTGYMLNEIGKEYGIVQETGESFDTFQNRIWAKKWLIYPSKTEIQRYFAHFARLNAEEVEITSNYRSHSSSGVESIIDIKLPYVITNSKFTAGNTFWNVMAERCEPAGTLVRFAFLVAGGSLTGTLDLEQIESAQMPYYSGSQGIYETGVSGNLTGAYLDPHVYGFGEASFASVQQKSMGGWYAGWGAPSMYGSVMITGSLLVGGVGGWESGDDCCSGYSVVSGDTYTWCSGGFEGREWTKWAWPSGGQGTGGVWHTGTLAEEGYSQDLLFSTGTYYWDNFWASGLAGVQY